MLPLKHRLNLRFHRQRVVSQGKTSRSPLFTIVTAPRKNPPARFAILLSRKLTKSAPKRNKLKRQISEYIRKNVNQFPPNLDRLIIPQKSVLTISLPKLLQDLNRLLSISKTDLPKI